MIKLHAGGIEPGQRDLQLFPRQLCLLRAQDQRVAGADDVIADQQFLVQFFTGTQPHKINMDRAIRGLVAMHFQSAQMHHPLRQIDDFDRVTHVEHGHVATLADGAGLQHQLGRFGDGHEIARDIGMGDRHGTTRDDLPAE